MKRSRVPSLRPTLRSSLYVVAVALSAALGFARESPWPILVAAVLALPTSTVSLPCYYFVYAVLALVPGANPSSGSGSSTSSADGVITTVTTGMPAAWFTVTTHLVGTLALTVAACLNVLLFRALAAWKRDRAAS